MWAFCYLLDHPKREANTLVLCCLLGRIEYVRCGLLRSLIAYNVGVCQSVCHAGDCSYLFARWRHFDAAVTTLL